MGQFCGFRVRTALLAASALGTSLAIGGAAQAAAINGPAPSLLDGAITLDRTVPGEDRITITGSGVLLNPPLVITVWHITPPPSGTFTVLDPGELLYFRREDGEPLEILTSFVSSDTSVRFLLDGRIYAQTFLNGSGGTAGRLVFDSNAAGLDFGANADIRTGDLVLRGQSGSPLSVNWQGSLGINAGSLQPPGGTGVSLSFVNLRATAGGMIGGPDSRLSLSNSTFSMDDGFSLTVGSVIMQDSTLIYGGPVTTGAMTLAEDFYFDGTNLIGVGGQRTLTLSGQLHGGSFNKYGTGRLTLSGNSDIFGGSVVVQDGELRVSGQYVGYDVTAAGQSTLVSGTGTVRNLGAALGAAIAPGNDGVGTLNVDGNLQFGQGGIYRADVLGGAADRLAVTGTAQFTNAPTLQLNGLGGNYVLNTPYVLIQANGGVTGTFAQVTGLNGFSAIYNPQIVYTPTQVQLLLSINNLLDLLGPADGSDNEIATLGMIDDAVDGGFDPSGLAALYALSPGALLDAADQLSGEAYATASRVALDDERLVREAVIGRLGGTSGDGAGVWADVHGSWGEGESDGNAAAYDRDLTGFVVGVDTGRSWAQGGWRVGVLAQTGTSELTIDDRGSSAKIKRTGAGLYGGVEAGGFSIKLGGVYSQLDLDVDRDIVFSGFSQSARGDADGRSVQGFGEIAYRFELGEHAALEPFAQFSAVSVKFDALRETGGDDVALFVDEQENTLLTSLVGLRAESSFAMGGGTMSLSGSVAARFLSGDRSVAALIALNAAPGETASISAAALDSSAFVGSLEAKYAFSETGSLSVGYSGLFADSGDDHAVRAGAAFRF
jgi:fibronectin-binding autotransporter adhesin